MPDVQTTQAPVRDAFDARGFGSSNMDDPALAAAFAAADREAGQALENLSPPESRGVVWEDSLGFPDGDLNEVDEGLADSDIEDYCAEIVFWLTDFSDAEEGLSNWTVFSEHHAA
ncbi:MAG: hypothetical protein JWO82_54 [Akkermansiaceae bacterium]|nr:hypothetical protein [Akkermansiaceae bacterium]